jgi:hypothetical protein
MHIEQMKILEMIAQGIISAEEGEALLDSIPLETEAAEDSEPGTSSRPEILGLERDSSTPPAWAQFWPIPVATGAIIASLGSGYSVLAVIGILSRWWLLLTVPGLAIGLLIFLTGWLMRTGPWLRIHVKDQANNIRLSLPVPTYWLIELVKLTQHFVPSLREWISDDLLIMLVESSEEGLFKIEVEEETGQYVRISYG